MQGTVRSWADRQRVCARWLWGAEGVEGAATLKGAGLGQGRAHVSTPAQLVWDYLKFSTASPKPWNPLVWGKKGWLVTVGPCQADSQDQAHRCLCHTASPF